MVEERAVKFIKHFLFAGICILIITNFSFGQKAKISHPSVKSKAYNYKIGQNIIYQNGGHIFLAVSLDKQIYKCQKILANILQMKCLHPAVGKIGIIILDNYGSAKRLTERQADNPTYEKDHSAVRGFYSFDKDTGIEYLEIALEKGAAEQKYGINLSMFQCSSK